jgi:hypothetical protein
VLAADDGRHTVVDGEAGAADEGEQGGDEGPDEALLAVPERVFLVRIFGAAT